MADGPSILPFDAGNLFMGVINELTGPYIMPIFIIILIMVALIAIALEQGMGMK